MDQARKKKLIVVLGMHRSGTSAITRGLNVLGVELGTSVMPGAPNDNEKGFFEDLDIVAINQEILTLLGHDWDVIARVPLERFPTTQLRSLRDRAFLVLQSKIEEFDVFGIKDPRISRLLPFWIPVFEKLALDVCYVISLRNPKSVAASLNQRNNISPTESYWLWLSYMCSSLLESSGKRVLVNFDNLLDAPYPQLLRIANHLDLPTPEIESFAFKEYESDFLDSRLRHTKYEINAISSPHEVPPLVTEAFGKLLLLEHSETPSVDPLIIDWFATVRKQLLLFDIPSYRLTQKIVDTMAERDNAIAERNNAIAERNNAIAERNNAIAERNNAIAERNNAIAERNNAVAYVEFLKTTNSWRLTRPLRFIGRLARHGLTKEDRQQLGIKIK